MNKKALIAMSGGVDSSVAAFLMKEYGYSCMGVTMKLYDNDTIGESVGKTCCSLDDIEDARSVAFHLGIPYHVFNFKDEFQEKVIQKFIKTYENGGTPNPCIDCNRYLKFEKLFQRAGELGCDSVVTGHYASVEYSEKLGRYLLKKGADSGKDQSYVLYTLTQKQLMHTVFPLGKYNKSEIRKIAEENGFINSDKKDSQDICFVPNGDYASFIEKHTGKKYPNGKFKTIGGETIGEHRGIIRYTIGQRKGLGISYSEPLYVYKKDLDKNEVILSSNKELFTKEVTANDINLISTDEITEPVRIKARTRYNMKEQPATAFQLDENTIKVVFDEPQRAVAAGQALVLYDGDYVLGGGTII
ncbi:MAG: tRNA 2-thiouridine(34) synthase MnmA [Clostridiales bacterium]|nr:tRNA 2-thiouridine(34) synthase MnmA [Clostridiales bacterium]